ncbi:Eukaryotic translation initiation factor 3 subunit C [Caligus rogercresseyi]|uniref:Eukaryotic translation initiation factor 3 subunit C n=1 Tax=Caligus rogercresseyi TaxID=217165 RepID=A0A7T8GXN8_CALRO|nr:Eukaryotic translation initiation factor 3 subunit C [Caligus rogercresseyi]
MRMVWWLSDGEDEGGKKRVLRSVKDKRYEKLMTLMKDIRNSKKIRDFNKMETSFQDMTKARANLKDSEEGSMRFYTRILVEMEDFINESWENREERKKMSKINSKSLGALRQQFRKYVRDYEELMTEFRKDPDAPDGEYEMDSAKSAVMQKQGDASSSSGSDSDSGDDTHDRGGAVNEPPKLGKEAFLKKRQGSEEESDSDSYWDSSEAESSSDSFEPGMSIRDQFVSRSLLHKRKKSAVRRRISPVPPSLPLQMMTMKSGSQWTGAYG